MAARRKPARAPHRMQPTDCAGTADLGTLIDLLGRGERQPSGEEITTARAQAESADTFWAAVEIVAARNRARQAAAAACPTVTQLGLFPRGRR